jgi:uncharacterized protein
MKKIGLLSDTHSFLHPKIFEFFAGCDEIWHAGDIGDISITDNLSGFRPLRAVCGNIDGADLRKTFPSSVLESVENVRFFMTHIGGYPGHYPQQVREILEAERPQLFICGHSHILKVMYDRKYELLHINPGAAGKFGFHRSITLVRFVLEKGKIKDLEVLDIPRN